jgi:peptidoglycan/xylan/chitin deacetylase (PgdA/CDA1 family)
MSGTIFAYHAIGECAEGDDPHNLFVATASFADQMRHLAARYDVVSLQDLIENPGGPRRVAITFDDAYRNVLGNAVPILESYGFTATVFVPTAHLGGSNTWDPPSSCDLGIMSTDELLEAAARGISFESHGHRHLDMALASPEEVRRDIRLSVGQLTEILGTPPRYLAYPYGRSSAAARQVAAEEGFSAAFSIDALDAGPFARERVQITPRDRRFLFALKASGRYLNLRYSKPLSAAYRVLKPLVRR